MGLIEIAEIVAIIGYIIAFYQLSCQLMTEAGPDRKQVALIAGLAVLCHGIAIVSSIVIDTGLNFSLSNTLSLTVWIMALGITINMARLKVLMVAPAVYLLALIGIVALWLVPPVHLTDFEQQPALLIHIILALISYALLLLVGLYAIQLAVINRRLKQRQLMLNSALPPLMTVEKQLYLLAWIGFALLTAALATGWLFLENFFGEGQGHKAVLSTIAWLLYASLLIRHHISGVQIRTTVAVSVSGAVILSIAYFGARVIKEMILK